jgi:hypothetical protein
VVDDTDTEPDTSAPDPTETTNSAEPTGSTGTLRELFLGVIWLGTSMWTAHATISGGTGGMSGALAEAAAALPGVVAATLFTGATIGHAAGSRFRSASGRLLAGLGLGAAFGAIAAALIRFGYGSSSSITVLAVTVGAASLLGGAVAVLPDQVLESGLWATSWVFFAGVIFGVLQPQLVKLLGGGTGAAPAAQAAADTRFTYAQSVLTGLLAGYFALQFLHGGGRRVWLRYAVAGLLPGLVLLAAEALTRLGGTTLVKLVHGFTADHPVLVSLNDTVRLRHALIVLAGGGIVTLVAGARAARRGDDG